jgi:hypothetical protein
MYYNIKITSKRINTYLRFLHFHFSVEFKIILWLETINV